MRHVSKEWCKNCLEVNKPHKSRRRKECMIQEYSTRLPYMLHTATSLVLKLAIQVRRFSRKETVLSSLMSNIFDLSFQNHTIPKAQPCTTPSPCQVWHTAAYVIHLPSTASRENVGSHDKRPRPCQLTERVRPKSPAAGVAWPVPS